MLNNNKLIEQHEKSIQILELISKAKNCKNAAQSNLNLYNATTDIYSPIRLCNTESSIKKIIGKYRAIEIRLSRWYVDVLYRINAELTYKNV